MGEQFPIAPQSAQHYAGASTKKQKFKRLAKNNAPIRYTKLPKSWEARPTSKAIGNCATMRTSSWFDAFWILLQPDLTSWVSSASKSKNPANIRKSLNAPSIADFSEQRIPKNTPFLHQRDGASLQSLLASNKTMPCTPQSATRTFSSNDDVFIV